ncbi:hypothetical protein [Mesorhizobium sp. B2-5-9]|uniref:hypothetical protein n=1 Tax=Mesorhizobium sp. B2-5-9 TaxID=2589921 RepID=UPI001FEFB3E8|nr:hypothetical protein [Mesorhizobium sp. B2-5-9]
MTKYRVEEIYGDTVVVSGDVVETDPRKAAETLAGQSLSPGFLQDHWFRVVDEERSTVYGYSMVGPDQRPDLLAWNESADFGPPIRGKVHGAELADEQDHFYNCPSCRQRVDMRDLRQVFWHEEPGHAPMKPEPEAKVIEFPKRK